MAKHSLHGAQSQLVDVVHALASRHCVSCDALGWTYLYYSDSLRIVVMYLPLSTPMKTSFLNYMDHQEERRMISGNEPPKFS